MEETRAGGIREDEDLQALLRRLEPLQDSRCGVLRGLMPMSFALGDGPLMHAYAVPAGAVEALRPAPLVGSRGDSAESWGYGTAVESVTAKVRAVCEAIERYCCLLHANVDVVEGTARSLGDRALDPRRLPQCSVRERAKAPAEHRLRQPDLDYVDQWVPGFSVTRDEEMLVPISATYLGIPLPLSAHLAFPESTGFATGVSWRAAVLSGLYEVIERDSIAVWWLHQLPMPRLRLADFSDPVIAELARGTARIGLQSRLIDVSTDVGVPVAALVQTSARSHPHALVAAACRSDMSAAVRRTFEEAGSLRLALGGSTDVGVDPRSGGPVSPRAFGGLYARAEGRCRFDFVDASATAEPPASSQERDPLAMVVRRLADLGAEVIAVDVTRPEIREFGIVVVRVIVPELMRISFAHHIRYLAHPRLYALPARLGYGLRTEDDVTDDPQPLA